MKKTKRTTTHGESTIESETGYRGLTQKQNERYIAQKLTARELHRNLNHSKKLSINIPDDLGELASNTHAEQILGLNIEESKKHNNKFKNSHKTYKK